MLNFIVDLIDYTMEFSAPAGPVHTMSKRPICDKYMIFGESRKLIDPKTYEIFCDVFETVYYPIANYFNYGLPRYVEYVIDPEYKGVAYTDCKKVVLNPEWIAKHPWDVDCMTHEVIHCFQAYKHPVPMWLMEGICDYGRELFGLYNKESGWALPAYNEKHNYEMGYRVTGSFLRWMDAEYSPRFVYDLNNAIKVGKYTDNYFKEVTGKTIDELWAQYAKANSPK